MSRNELVLVLRELITEQSEGEWTDEMIKADAEKFADRLFPLMTGDTSK